MPKKRKVLTAEEWMVVADQLAAATRAIDVVLQMVDGTTARDIDLALAARRKIQSAAIGYERSVGRDHPAPDGRGDSEAFLAYVKVALSPTQC